MTFGRNIQKTQYAVTELSFNVRVNAVLQLYTVSLLSIT